MIDRMARYEMANALEEYLRDDLTSLDFDREIAWIAYETSDETVKELRIDLWLLYDDLKDHEIVADKETWDYLHRVLLLLRSDGEFEATRESHWTVRQTITICCVGVWIATVAVLGLGTPFLCVHIAVGLVSMAVMYWQYRNDNALERPGLAPFSSLYDIYRVRRTLPLFSKTKYPSRLVKRRIRGGFSAIASWLFLLIYYSAILEAWLALSPLVLLLQSRKEQTITSRVVLP